MTATLSLAILKLLEKMTGIKVSPQNYLWDSRTSMSRRNMCVHVDFATQQLRHMKMVLSSAT